MGHSDSGLGFLYALRCAPVALTTVFPSCEVSRYTPRDTTAETTNGPMYLCSSFPPLLRLRLIFSSTLADLFQRAQDWHVFVIRFFFASFVLQVCSSLPLPTASSTSPQLAHGLGLHIENTWPLPPHCWICEC